MALSLPAARVLRWTSGRLGVVFGTALLASSTTVGATPTSAQLASVHPQALRDVVRIKTAPDQGRESRAVLRRRTRRVRGLLQLSGATGLSVRDSSKAWGTRLTLDRLRALGRAYHEAFPQAGPIHVHDISHRWGGRMPSHRSHRTGRDVDLRIMFKREDLGYVNATARTLDLERTWFVLYQLVSSGDVEYIFVDRRLQRVLYRHALEQGFTAEELRPIFEWPRRGVGIIRHWRGHADHLHIRFRSRARQPDLV